eukprot:sb/3477493/
MYDIMVMEWDSFAETTLDSDKKKAADRQARTATSDDDLDGCRVVLNPGQFIDDYLWRLNLRDNKVLCSATRFENFEISSSKHKIFSRSALTQDDVFSTHVLKRSFRV